MPLERVPLTASVIDVLDHVLDKGIVIDAWVRAPVARWVVEPVGRWHTVEEQLRHVGEQMEHRFGRQERRRLEDRIREERRDAGARTISGDKR